MKLYPSTRYDEYGSCPVTTRISGIFETARGYLWAVETEAGERSNFFSYFGGGLWQETGVDPDSPSVNMERARQTAGTGDFQLYSDPAARRRQVLRHFVEDPAAEARADARYRRGY